MRLHLSLIWLVCVLLLAGCGAPETSAFVPGKAVGSPTPFAVQIQPRLEATPISALTESQQVVPTETPEPIVASVTYTTTVDEGWVFYENPSVGFAITLPPSWQQLNLDPNVVEARVRELRARDPKLAETFDAELRSFQALGVSFYAFDGAPGVREHCTCPPSLAITKPDAHGKTLDGMVDELLHELDQLPYVVKPVSHRRVTLAAGAAEEFSYRTDISSTDGKSLARNVTEYYFTDGKTAFVIALSTPIAHAGEYSELFPRIGKSFRLVER